MQDVVQGIATEAGISRSLEAIPPTLPPKQQQQQKYFNKSMFKVNLINECYSNTSFLIKVFLLGLKPLRLSECMKVILEINF